MGQGHLRRHGRPERSGPREKNTNKITRTHNTLSQLPNTHTQNYPSATPTRMCCTCVVLLLHCSCACVANLLHLCCNSVALLLHLCGIVVAMLPHSCCTVATLVLHFCFTFVSLSVCIHITFVSIPFHFSFVFYLSSVSANNDLSTKTTMQTKPMD